MVIRMNLNKQFDFYLNANYISNSVYVTRQHSN